MRAELLADLEAFTAIAAPSGRESGLSALIRDRWSEHAPVSTDGLGNLSITVGEGPVHIALVAHLDEVGFVVRRITDDGFVRLTRVGGVPERVLPMQDIVLLGVAGPVTGVVGTWPHHFTPAEAKYRVPPVEEMYLDVGARSRAEVVDDLGVRVGDYGVYARNFRTHGDRVFSNALDDRAGLAIITDVLAQLQGLTTGRVSLIASVQEEFSIRGLVPTVRRLAPDVLVVVDVSPATDTPETAGHASDVRLGAGPVMHLHSFHGRGTLAGVIPPDWLVAAVDDAARAAEIAVQRAIFFGGLTDGSFAQLEGNGIPAIELAIPVRYTHSPTEVCSLTDVQHLSDLLTALWPILPAAVEASR